MIALRLAPLLLAAIASVAAAPAEAEPALTGAALKEACAAARGVDYRIFLAPEVARQGAELTISTVSRSPEAPWGQPIPVACFKRWTVSDPKVAGLSAGATRLTIARDAAPGATASLSAVIDGKTVTLEFTVIAADAVVLTGYWREVGDAACPAGDPPLRELRFLPNGRFEATWTPFETYVDFWGPYSFDAATGAITFTPDGGNRVPQGADLAGEARLDQDGLLRLTGIDFRRPGQDLPARPDGCPLIFKTR